MPNIPGYERYVIKPRETPQLYNPSAVADAASPFAAAGNFTAGLAEIADAHARADEATAVNDAILKKKREDLEFLDQARKQNEGNPFGFAKRIEKDIGKRDEERLKALPTERAKKAYGEELKRLNLSIYEENFNWENTRKTQIYAQRVENSIENANLLALRAGREGKPVEDIFKEVDATTASAGGVLSRESLQDINQRGRSDAVSYWLQGIIERNPYEAKRILEGKQYDVAFGAERLQRAYTQAETSIAKIEAETARAEKAKDFISGNRLADPGSKEDRDVIDEMYVSSGMVERFAQGDLQAVGQTTDIIKRTGIIPESVQRTVRGSLTSGDSAQKQQAYSFIAQVQEVKPDALLGKGGFEQKEINDAVVFNGLIRSGATTEFAQRAVDMSKNPIEAPIRQVRQQEAVNLSSKYDESKILPKFDDIMPFTDPDFLGQQNQAKAVAEYQRVFREAYLQYGDEKAAEAMADAAFTTKYGVSYINDSRSLMEYPPEQHYGIPNLDLKDNAEWMREELAENLKEAKIKASVDEVFLVPTLDTQAIVSNGGKPLYHVWEKIDLNGQEVYDIARGDDNMPLVIGFETQKQIEKLKSETRTDAEKVRNFAIAQSKNEGLDILKFIDRKIYEALVLTGDDEPTKKKMKTEKSMTGFEAQMRKM